MTDVRHGAPARPDSFPRGGALVAGALILAAIAIVVVATRWLRGPHGPVVYAELRSAPGLHEGARVTFRGIAVGTVTHVGFADDGLRLTIALSRRDVPLRSGDGVRATPNGIFGDLDVEIVPGPASAPPLAAGGSLGEAAPDSAAIRQRALADAFVRRLGDAFQSDSARPTRGDSVIGRSHATP